MGVVGIDLGTTNTVVATMRDGRVHVLADEEGHRLLPSVVSFHPNGDVLVGRVAKSRRAIDGRNTIASFKRLLGQSWGSEEIERARFRFPFDLHEGPESSVVVAARGQEYTLSEISAFVLKRAKQIAEHAMGESVERAVITVPAHFNELQRTATKVAGRVAGLEVMRILNEPTAAALAYGLGMAGTRERTCVYDFGGGTFDCTVLDLSGEVFEVLATAGDTFLGGDDVDASIAEVMADQFLQQHRWDPRSDRQAFERLRLAAERVKIDLTRLPETKIQIREIGYGVGGKALDLTFRISRRELDVILAPLVERTFLVTQDALNVAQQTVTSVDRVVLVGGSSRSPFVRQRVEQFFGRPPMDRVNPDEVVAIGAAIQAATLADERRVRKVPAPPLPAAARGKPTFNKTVPQFGGETAVRTRVDSRERFGEEPSLGLPPSQQNLLPESGAFADDDSLTQMLPTHASEPPPSFPSFGSAAVQTQRSADERTQAGIPESHRSGSRMPIKDEFGSLPPDAFGSIAPFPGEEDDDMPGALGGFGGGNTNTGTLTKAAVSAALSSGAVNTQPRGGMPMPPPPHDLLPALPPVSRPPTAGSAPPLPYAPMPSRPPQAQTQASQQHARPSAMPQGQFGSLPPDAFGSVPPAVYQASSPPPNQVRSFAPSPRAAYAAATGFDDEDSLNPTGRLPEPAEFPSSLPPAPFPPYQTQSPSQLRGGPPAAPPRIQPYLPSEPPAPPQAESVPPSFRSLQSLPSAQAGNAGQQGAGGGQAPFFAPGPQIRSRSEMPHGPAPVLVDVTPRALVVETVGGFCDVVLPRNAKIPCERTRKFATAVDNQTSVRVRVAQGERAQFSRNVLLGEVELNGLAAGKRGEVTIAVTFELDPNGNLKVRATDATTGQVAQAVLQLVGVADDEPSIVSMVGRLAAIPVSSRMS